MNDESRPNIGIVRVSDATLLGLVHIDDGALGLTLWQGRLVDCKQHQEIDLASAVPKLVPSASTEACDGPRSHSGHAASCAFEGVTDS